MPLTLKLLIILSFSPVLALILHIIVSRIVTPIKPEASRQLLCLLSILLGNIPMVVVLWLAIAADLLNDTEGLVSTILYSLIVYNAFGYTYFHIFNMSETARRIRLLFEIRTAGTLTGEQINNLYGSSDMFEVRIERLLSMAQIEMKDGRYYLKGRFFFYVARIVAFWAGLIGFHFLERFERNRSGH